MFSITGHGPAAFSGMRPSAQGFDSKHAPYVARYPPAGAVRKDAEPQLHDPASIPSGPKNTAAAPPGGKILIQVLLCWTLGCNLEPVLIIFC